eukprot:SAG11_NODE_1720_length_4377_cov_5.551426_5_plen_149_part_00
MVAAVTADESTSVGMGAFCLLFPGGPGACAVLPTDTGFHSELYQTDVLSMANRTGGAATAAVSNGSPGSPRHGNSMTNNLCFDLLWGSGDEKKFSNSTFAAAPQRAQDQLFSTPSIMSRCGNALSSMFVEWRRFMCTFCRNPAQRALQ